MPEQQDCGDGTQRPDEQTLSEAPIKSGGKQTIPPNIPNDSATNYEDDSKSIANEIKRGEKWLIFIGFATFIVNSFIGFIYWQQLKEMVGVSGQTDSLTRAYRRQEMDIANLAQETNVISESTKTISIDGGIQAKAARSAALTAQNALRISERAYIVTGSPRVDIEKRTIFLPLINTGRIPSGSVTLIAHEGTVNGSLIVAGSYPVAEAHWDRAHYDSITPLSSNQIDYGIAVPKIDWELLKTNKQKITIAGTISYRDGFNDTKERTWLFCITTVHGLPEIVLSPCDATFEIHQLALADGYHDDKQ